METDQTRKFCLNCAQHRCYMHIKIPVVIETSEEETNISNPDGNTETNANQDGNVETIYKMEAKAKPETPQSSKLKMKEEEICKREIGKMIQNQVGKQAFSCTEPNSCQCRCRKFNNKKSKKIARGIAIGGLVVAGTGCLVGAFLVAALTMGAGIVAAPPMIFGGLGLITGAFFEFERGHRRRVRKKALMACYKGKLLDPYDYGIDIYVEGATPLRNLFNEDMSEILLSTSEVTNVDRPHQHPETVNSCHQQQGLRISSPYAIQLPHRPTNREIPQQGVLAQDLVYEGAPEERNAHKSPPMVQSQPINYETMSPFQTEGTQFPPQLHCSQRNAFEGNNSYNNINSNKNNANNTFPSQWTEQLQLKQPSYTCTVPCYFHPSDDNNMLQKQYVNHPYLSQQPSNV